jgi:hypothetical protein
MKNVYLWLTCCLLAFASCKKTISPTQGELNAAALKNAFTPSNIVNVTVYNLDNGSTFFSGTSISISDNGMATIGAGTGATANFVTVNLGLMKSYQVGSNYLNLYF